MAGEVFSRGVARPWSASGPDRPSPCFDSASLYGTADAGVLGNETPLSVCIRRFLAAQPEAARELFGESRCRRWSSTTRGRRFFEAHDGTLLFSADNGVPLVRYHIADSGGLIAYADMLEFLARHGFDPMAESRRR